MNSIKRFDIVAAKREGLFIKAEKAKSTLKRIREEMKTMNSIGDDLALLAKLQADNPQIQ